MKVACVLVTLLALACAEETNPVSKVIQLLSDLETKIIAEGEEAHKVYAEFAEWCDDTSKNLQYEIKTEKAEVAELKATIEGHNSAIGSLNAKIEELAASVAQDDKDLAEATKLREKEAADFAASEKELLEVISALERAIQILEREAAKGGAAMIQVQNVAGLVQALTVLVDAGSLSSADSSTLSAFVQQQNSDEDAGAPDAAVYESHSGGIISTLEGLLDKANDELSTLRHEETTAKHNFEMLAQSLNDSIKYADRDMDAAKKSLAENQAGKATAEGDLDTTSKDLANDVKELANLHHNCLSKANEYEAEQKSRDEELKALAHAKKVVSESTGGTGGAEELEYTSFMQLSTSRDLSNFEAIRFVKDLARKQHSPLLAQLASRMTSAARLAHGAGDVFAKVKGLIEEMVKKLEADAAADASHKAYCDKEMGETQTKKEDKMAELSKLNSKIGLATAQSAKLKEEVATLQHELAQLAKEQAEMDKVRAAEHELFAKNKPEYEQGIAGVKLALKVLREYYAKEGKAHQAAEGAGQGIIGLLEVVESDFTKTLAEMEVGEQQAAAQYDQQTKENEITKATKEQDVKYKTQEAAGLDKSVGELTSDRDGVQAELDAIMEYWTKLTEQCVAKAEPYAERKRRREAELAGLKEALGILEGVSFVQKRTLRGVLRH